jgi:hypothetical protein
LTEAARGGVSTPSTTRAGDTITVVVGGEYAGTEVNIWLHSTPRLLATAVVGAAGLVEIHIPSDAQVANHRIVVTTTDGTLIGWDDIEITADSGDLVSTGADATVPGLLALLLLLAGLVTVLSRRRVGRSS